MSSHTIQLTDAVYRYLLDNGVREHPVLAELREETATHEWSRMQISPEQGQFMNLLVKLCGARRILELGVFTGYSSLCMALALPGDGKLVACDVNKDYTDVARRFWSRAGVGEKVELRLAPALETLDALLSEGQGEHFDLAFVDAVKEEYLEYYQRLLCLLRPGGLILVDNVLWGGDVAQADKDDAETIALRAFNRQIHGDERVDLAMLPVGDGLSLIRLRH